MKPEPQQPDCQLAVWRIRGGHSYYHEGVSWKDSVVYKGHTHLFEDQLAVGNVSLSGVQLSDQGPYTCDVMDEQGLRDKQVLSYWHKIN